MTRPGPYPPRCDAFTAGLLTGWLTALALAYVALSALSTALKGSELAP